MDVMGIDLNKRVPVPRATHTLQAMKNIRDNDKHNIKLLLDLMATLLQMLWPGYDHPR